MNVDPLDLNGPTFLGLYILILLVAGGAAYYLRWRSYGPSEETEGTLPNLDPYEIAYLAGGSDRVMNTAFARLCHVEALAPDAEQRHLTVQTDLGATAHPVEQAVFRGVRDAPEKTIREVRAAPPVEVERLRERLEAHGLLLSPRRVREARQWPVAIMLNVTLLGAHKIFIGIDRQRPVELLVFLCIVSGIVLLYFLSDAGTRTRRGEEFLMWQKERNAALHVSVGCSKGLFSGRDLALAVGLFGLGVLHAGPLAPMAKALVPPSSGGCGGGCGGGGCGGGGCGGGCGGCGGGCGG